jgi:hypothetical protein
MRKKIFQGALEAIDWRVNNFYETRERMPSFLKRLRTRIMEHWVPGDVR